MNFGLAEISAFDAVAAMKRGEFSAEEYALSLLAQCERGRSLNAFITLEPERVLEAARAADRLRLSGAELGPLHGLPVPVKDSINTRDLPTTCGTAALREFRPREDAAIVATLRKAGAIVLGKTNLHELSMGWTSNNFAFGAVRNPYDPMRIAGGSSGGTAVAVAARMAPLGLAEDTEGSIRVPAALCGLAGFRPSTLRYPSTGTAPISSLFDQVGPVARRVGDLDLFDSAVTGDFQAIQPAKLKGLKLGVGRGYWFAGLDDRVAGITSAALKKMEDAGVELVEAEVPDLAALIQQTTLAIQVYDMLRELPQYLRESGAQMTFDQMIALASPEIQEFLAFFGKNGGGFISDQVYEAARNTHLPRMRQTFRDYFARTGVAAIVFPTTMVSAPLIGEGEDVMIGGEKVPFITAMARNIAPGSTAGLPGLVLPTGLTQSGLPVSIEFDGPAGADRALLGLGLSMEELLGEIEPPPI